MIGGAVVYFFLLMMKKPIAEVPQKTENTFVNPAVEIRKENIQKLASFISQKSADEQITNDQVQDFLSVSDATAERYLQELEKQGKIRQVSQEGRGVHYLKV